MVEKITDEEFKDLVEELAKKNGIKLKYMFFILDNGKATAKAIDSTLLEAHMILAHLERQKHYILEFLEKLDKNKKYFSVEHHT